MLRIGICDDLANALLVLRSALERILENRKIQGQFFEFSSGETLLRWYDHHAGELDVVFLIWNCMSWTAWRLPGGSGQRMRGSSWCSSPDTPTTSLTDTAWELLAT